MTLFLKFKAMNRSNKIVLLNFLLSFLLFIGLNYSGRIESQYNVEFIVSFIFGLVLFVIESIVASVYFSKPFGQVIAEFYKNINLNIKIGCFFTFLLIAFFYRYFLFGDQFTPANFYYAMRPGNSIIGETHGVLLSDPIDSFLPIKYFISETIKNEKRIPFWNPYTGMGYSIESEVGSTFGYLPHWLILLFPRSVGLLACTFFEMYICLWGMYLFLGRLNLSVFSRLIGAITYTFSGTLIAWLLWPHTSVAMLAPLLFYFTDKMIEKNRPGIFLILTAIVTEMLYAGMPPYVAYFYYLLGAYTIFRAWTIHRNWKACINNIGMLFLVAIISGLISFPYTFNLIESIFENDYLSQRTNSYQATFAPKILTQLLCVNHKFIPGHYNEGAMYLGFFSLITLIAVPIVFKKQKNAVFWYCTTIIILIMVSTHILDSFVKVIPIINTSLKTRIIVLLMFSLSVLSAEFAHFLSTASLKKNIVLFCLLLWGIISITRYVLFQDKFAFIALFFFLSFLSLLFIASKKNVFIKTNQQTIIFMYWIIILISDLFIDQISYNPFIGRYTNSHPITESGDFLQAQEERFTALGGWTYFPNSAIRYHIYDIRSHSFSTTSAQMHHFFESIDSKAYASKTRIAINNIENSFGLSIAGVKNILTEKPVRPSNQINTINKSESPQLMTIRGEFEIVQQMTLPDINFNRIDINIQQSIPELTVDQISLNLLNFSNNETILDNIKGTSEAGKVTFDFDDIFLEGDQTYEIRLTCSNKQNNPIEIPLYSEEIPNSSIRHISMSINAIELNSFINISFIQDHKEFLFSRTFSDGLSLFVNENALDRVYLSRNIEFVMPDKQIDQMLSEKIIGKVFISQDTGIIETPIRDTEFVRITESQSDFMKIEANVEQKSVLVLSDTYNKNWKAFVNGSEQTIFPVNGLFRGIVLEPGNYQIEMYYVPNQFRNGAITSLSSILVLLFGYGLTRKKSASKALSREEL